MSVVLRPYSLPNFHLLLRFCLGFGLFIAPSKTGASQTVNTNSAEYQAYDNDELFDQLSGSGRNRAEKKFGKKHKHPKNGEEATSAPDSTGGAIPPGVESFSPLPNGLVNDPSVDSTS